MQSWNNPQYSESYLGGKTSVVANRRMKLMNPAWDNHLQPLRRSTVAVCCILLLCQAGIAPLALAQNTHMLAINAGNTAAPPFGADAQVTGGTTATYPKAIDRTGVTN